MSSLRIFSTGGVVVVWLMLVCAVSAASDRPNIILFVADDLGYGDIGCYGNAKNRTSHLDSLAAAGMRFTDFHANGPMCTPTRAALLTGQYQNRFGRIFEGPLSYQTDRDKGLPVTAMTVADALKPAGYATAMFGKWHLGYVPPFLPTRQGFDEFRGLLTGDGDHHSHISRSGNEDWWHQETLAMEAGYSVDLITQHSIDFIERHRAEPFFLYVAHLAIHFPWQGPNEEGYRRKGHSYWNLTKLGPHSPGQVGPTVREMVEAVDQSVGKIVATLRQLHLERRTFLLFTSDNGGYLDYAGRFHGEISSNGPLRGQKGDTFEGGHRVPAIASWPSQIEPGTTTHATAMTMDLMPTCLELAGRDVSRDANFSWLDGTTLTPVLLHGGQLPPRTLFWRSGHKCAVRRGPWKLVGYLAARSDHYRTSLSTGCRGGAVVPRKTRRRIFALSRSSPALQFRPGDSASRVAAFADCTEKELRTALAPTMGQNNAEGVSLHSPMPRSALA